MTDYQHYQTCHALLTKTNFARRFPKDAQALLESLYSTWIYACETDDWSIFEVELDNLWELIKKYE